MIKFVSSIFKVLSPLLLLWVVSTPLVNYILDPYGLLSKPHSSYVTEPNMRSIKTDYVKNLDNKKSLLLFSNSRGGVYHSNRENFYNMSYSGGMPEEFLEDLIFLVENNRGPDSVILFMDEKAIYTDYKNNWKKPVRRLYKLDDYLGILTIPLSINKVEPFFLSESRPSKTIKFHLDTDGHYEYLNFELNNDVDSVTLDLFANHRKNDISEVGNVWKNLLNYLDEHNIKYRLFIHPLSLRNVENYKYKVGDLDALIESLKLNGIAFENELCVIDAKENNCFYDASHYSDSIARLICNLD